MDFFFGVASDWWIFDVAIDVDSSEERMMVSFADEIEIDVIIHFHEFF